MGEAAAVKTKKIEIPNSSPITEYSQDDGKTWSPEKPKPKTQKGETKQTADVPGTGHLELTRDKNGDMTSVSHQGDTQEISRSKDKKGNTVTTFTNVATGNQTQIKEPAPAPATAPSRTLADIYGDAAAKYGSARPNIPLGKWTNSEELARAYNANLQQIGYTDSRQGAEAVQAAMTNTAQREAVQTAHLYNPLFDLAQTAPLRGTVDHTQNIYDRRGTALQYQQYVTDNTDKINASYEAQKKAAYIDPDAYRKDFMKDNYKSFQAVSDILSGLRIGLTGQSSGQTNADRVNALLADKLNALRDKNKDAQIQIGLEHQKALLGESTRVSQARADAQKQTDVENKSFADEFGRNFAEAQDKTMAEMVNNIYDQNVTKYNALTNATSKQIEASIGDIRNAEQARYENQKNFLAGIREAVKFGYDVNQQANANRISAEREQAQNISAAQVKDAEAKTAALNKQIDRMTALELEEYRSDRAMQDSLKLRMIEAGIKQDQAAEAMRILEKEGAGAYKAYLAAMQGHAYDAGLLTSIADEVGDMLNGRGNYRIN